MTVEHLIIEEVRQMLIPNQSVDEISERFKIELQNRLMKSKRSMLPSGLFNYQPSKRKIDDKLRYLAIDFGGTRLKIAILSILADKEIKIYFQDDIEITARIVNQAFFHDIVEWICQSLYKKVPDISELILLASTTFSFPLNSKNEIITMGKGFTLADDIKNVSLKVTLYNAFDHIIKSNVNMNNMNIIVCDFINDSVAVHLANRFSSFDNTSSLILGTGINSCFDLPVTSLPDFKKSTLTEYPSTSDIDEKKVLINSEIGFLGKNIINLSQYDWDSNSPVLFMPMEFISAGKYISLSLQKHLLAYQIITENSDIIFNGELFCKILTKSSIGIIKDEHLDIASQIAKLYIDRASIYVVSLLKAICSFSNDHNNYSTDKTFRIGYVGSFLEHCKYYQDRIFQVSGGNIQLELCENSNLIGAAVATHLNNRR